MTMSKHTMSTQPLTAHLTFAVGTKLRVLGALLAMSAASCDDPDELAQEVELDSLANDESYLVADPDDAADHSQMKGIDDLQAGESVRAASPCCEIAWGPNFQVYVKLVNPGPSFPGECSFITTNSVSYRVNHYYGDPAPYYGTTSSFSMGQTKLIPLSYNGSLNAMSCTRLSP